MKYTIPKGEHYSQPRRFGLHFGRTKQTWLVRFDESCLYESDFDYYQWNKGAGWIYGLFSDENSIRWCWRPKPENQKVIEVGVYVHRLGIVLEPKISQRIELPADLNEDFKFVLTYNTSEQRVFLEVMGNQISQVVDERFNANSCPGWLNFPYFGGKRKAPHDITISVTSL